MSWWEAWITEDSLESGLVGEASAHTYWALFGPPGALSDCVINHIWSLGVQVAHELSDVRSLMDPTQVGLHHLLQGASSGKLLTHLKCVVLEEPAP